MYHLGLVLTDESCADSCKKHLYYYYHHYHKYSGVYHNVHNGLWVLFNIRDYI